MSLSNYEEQKTLGQGSYGKVVKVKNKKNGLIYAMKKIKLNYTNDEEIQASLNEVRLLYSLNHPNIISYKEAFYDKPSNSLNIVIEYAGDGDLSQKIKMNKKYHKRIDENTIWDWVIQLIIGIYYLHSSNCIHRDLKSANIFLKKNGRIKIGDLGVSKFLKKEFAETFTGTPLYIAPEMLNDLPYDYKVDIWSLGCIIYELCALETPFNGRNMNELFKNIKAGRYIPIPNKYSNDLKKIIALMLQTNPNKRISSIELLYLPIIKSKMNKNYSKYQELIEKVKKPEIIQTILLQQKKLPKKDVIPKRSKSRDISKSRSKSKSKSRIKKPPVSVRKKKFINKNKDLNLKNRSSSARNNLRNYNPYYNKNRNQKYYNEHSERDYDNKSAFHNNYIIMIIKGNKIISIFKNLPIIVTILNKIIMMNLIQEIMIIKFIKIISLINNLLIIVNILNKIIMMNIIQEIMTIKVNKIINIMNCLLFIAKIILKEIIQIIMTWIITKRKIIKIKFPI